MERKWHGKVLFSLLLIVLSIGASTVTIVESLKGEDAVEQLPESLRELFPGINLGLDLQGGLRLVYEVQVQAAIEDKRDQLAEGIVAALEREAKLTDVDIVRNAGDENSTKFNLVFASEEDLESDEVQDVLTDYRTSLQEESVDGAIVHMALKEEVVDDTEKLSVTQATETIGNRIDEMGILNTSVVPRDVDIVVEIPGVDPKMVSRIKRIISMTARLEFKFVDALGSEEFFVKVIKPKLDPEGPILLKNAPVSDGVKNPNVKSYYLEAKNETKTKGLSGRQIIKKFFEDNKIEIPSDRAISYKEIQTTDGQGNPTADVSWRTFYLDRVAKLSGDAVESAMVRDNDKTGSPEVIVSFNQIGAKKFGDLTGDNVKRRMAIQLDDKVNSAPVINEKIGGGSAVITLGGYGDYTKIRAQARDLMVVLRAGALPAPIRPVTESEVGAEMGQDSVNMGAISLVAAFGLVIIFMLVYYRGAGIAADFSLIANAIFVFGILSAFGMTLTLPGIAGIILTLGMAVDANVIIYERIREELRGGKSPKASVDAGYKRAFWTIFDAQITTAIAGVVMLQYGTGAIKGFALTLLVGIVTSMFTAIFISRIFMDWMTRRRSDHLSI